MVPGTPRVDGWQGLADLAAGFWGQPGHVDNTCQQVSAYRA